MVLPLLHYCSILISALYACLAVSYSRKLLVLRVPLSVSYLALVGVVLGTGLTHLLPPIVPARWLVFFLLLAVYYFTMFHIRPLHVLFFCNIVLFPLVVLRNTLLALVSLAAHRSMSSILQDTGAPLLYSLLSGVLVCGLFLWFQHRYSADKIRLLLGTPATLRLLVYSQTMLHAFLLGAASIACTDSSGSRFALYHLSCCLLLLLVFYVLLDCCVNVSHTGSVELRASLLESQLEKQLHHYSLMSDYMTNLRKLGHDYRSMVTGLTRLLELEDTAGALAFVRDMQGQLVQATGSYRSYSNHPFVQAILTDAAEQAARSDIDFRAEVAVPTDFSLREIDICRIFNNLLSNAVEACEQLPQDSTRYIILSGRRQGGWFSLTVENSFDGKLVSVAGGLLTRKGDAAAHGMGLQNVQEIVERNGGVFRLEPDPAAGKFVVHLHLCCNPPELPPLATPPN